MQKDNFDKNFEEKIQKRYEEAKFYLDILIENKIIKTTDEKLKKLFISWFTNNKNFDLQIKNGDLDIEDGDIKFIPDFEKKDIVEFIKWFNKEKDNFINYLNNNGISSTIQTNIAEKTINTGNLIINQGKIKKVNQKIDSNDEKKPSKKNIIFTLIIIPIFVGLILLSIEKGVFSNTSVNKNNTTKVQLSNQNGKVFYEKCTNRGFDFLLNNSVGQTAQNEILSQENLFFLENQKKILSSYRSQLIDIDYNKLKFDKKYIDCMTSTYDFHIPSNMQKNDSILINLILISKSTETIEEKNDWFELYNKMTNEEVNNLYNILYREHLKLLDIEINSIEKRINIMEKYKRKNDSLNNNYR